jgi:hypothetical protein
VPRGPRQKARRGLRNVRRGRWKAGEVVGWSEKVVARLEEVFGRSGEVVGPPEEVIGRSDEVFGKSVEVSEGPMSSLDDP